MSGQNKNISRKNVILSLAPNKSYDQIQATLNLNPFYVDRRKIKKLSPIAMMLIEVNEFFY